MVMYTLNLLKSLIPATLPWVTFLSPRLCHRDLGSLKADLARKNQLKTDTESICLFYNLHHQSSVPFSSRHAFSLVFVLLPVYLQKFLLPFLSLISLNSSQALAFLSSSLQAQEVFSMLLLSPSPLMLSVYFHFAFELSQEFPVQPSWPPATPAVSCTSRWSSCALSCRPWRSLPCPVPLSETLLWMPKILAFLQFC